MQLNYILDINGVYNVQDITLKKSLETKYNISECEIVNLSVGFYHSGYLIVSDYIDGSYVKGKIENLIVRRELHNNPQPDIVKKEVKYISSILEYLMQKILNILSTWPISYLGNSVGRFTNGQYSIGQ